MFKTLAVLAVGGLVFAGCENRSETDNTNATNPPASIEHTPVNDAQETPAIDQAPADNTAATTASTPTV